MKITPAEFEEFQKIYEDVVGVSINLENAENYFENYDNADEFVLLPKLKPDGMSLILDHLDEKHKQQSNIVVVDCSSGKNNNLKQVLDTFNKMKEGSKMCLVIFDGSHWRTAYCERKNNKNHIALIDSCGITIVNNPLENVVNEDPLLKENTVLYRSVNKLQAAENNCGIFSIRTAQKLIQEQDFFGNLEKGRFILTKDEANAHFQRSKQLTDESNLPTNHFFVLPPQYFSLAQKKSYLKHYKDEFGARPGVSEFKTQTKAGDTVFIDDLINKTKREKALSDRERTIHYGGSVTKKEDHNVNVVYFSNKYIEAALFNLAKKNKEAHPDLDVEKRKELLRSKAQNRLSHTEKGKELLAGVAKKSTMDDILSKGDNLETATITVSKEDKEKLTSQKQEHYQILLAENTLQQSLEASTQLHRAASLTFGGLAKSDIEVPPKQEDILNKALRKSKSPKSGT